jgi:hypothetical protein
MEFFLWDVIDKIACQSTNLCMDDTHCNATIDFQYMAKYWYFSCEISLISNICLMIIYS